MGRIAAYGLLIIVAISFGIDTLADGEGEYDYRHGVMEAIGGHMSAMN